MDINGLLGSFSLRVFVTVLQLKNTEKVQQASREDAAQLAKIRGPELEGSDKSADPELLKKVCPAKPE